MHYIRGSYKGEQRREEAKNRYKQVPYYIGGGGGVMRVNKVERKPEIDTSKYLI